MSIDSPCVSICDVDPDTELCLGCGRSLDEIAGWIGFSDAERARIMAELPTRLDGGSSVAQSLGTTSETVTCPYCNERYELVVDPSVDHQSYVEDCFVCCQPIVFDVTVNDGSVAVVASAENA